MIYIIYRCIYVCVCVYIYIYIYIAKILVPPGETKGQNWPPRPVWQPLHAVQFINRLDIRMPKLLKLVVTFFQVVFKV